MVHFGIGSNVRIPDMGTSKWSMGVLENLPSLNAISGCDYVNSSFRRTASFKEHLLT